MVKKTSKSQFPTIINPREWDSRYSTSMDLYLLGGFIILKPEIKVGRNSARTKKENGGEKKDNREENDRLSLESRSFLKGFDIF